MGAAAILDLPEVRARVFQLSVDSYEALGAMDALDKRAELIRGVIVQNMPISPLHRAIAHSIFLFFVALHRAGLTPFMEAPLRLADSVPQPDVMLVRGARSDFKARHPTTAELVVEIAVTSLALDRENASLYAEAGVTEYWIVLAEDQQIEVYREPVNGVYQQKRLYSVGDPLDCLSAPGVIMPLAEWFA